jgi:murein DD-endopeptidase MepM/ murein hydrolase activator NlpD
VAPSPTPAPSATPDVVLAAIAHLSPSERLDDRTAASADWPLVAVDPARQPTPETKTVEQTITHIVVKGETLASIANQSGVSIDAIVQANNLGDMNVLAVGQRLAIPTGKQSIVTTVSRVADTLEPHFIWPARAPITTYFGERGTIWKGGSHTGLDIGANFGTPIIAAEAGVVLEAGWATTRGYGNYVKIDNGLGYQTLYGHMSVIRAKEGQLVNRGDRIGDVGSTGVSTGPHLHFEMRLNGQPVDPLPYLPKS